MPVDASERVLYTEVPFIWIIGGSIYHFLTGLSVSVVTLYDVHASECGLASQMKLRVYVARPQLTKLWRQCHDLVSLQVQCLQIGTLADLLGHFNDGVISQHQLCNDTEKGGHINNILHVFVYISVRILYRG